MNYFKNVDLAEMYKVSEKSIRNWIEYAKNGKVDLELIQKDKRSFIANTPLNHLTLKELSSKGKKFKNRKSLKLISPKPEFYEIFDETQIVDIITNLEVNKEIDLKYAYFNFGANYWNDYVLTAANETVVSNTTTNTIQLLDLDKEYIYSLFKNVPKVNLVDIGPGNGLPVRKFLEFLLSKNKLNKYIALDYSQNIIDITKQNLINWFGEDFPFESQLMDVTRDTFQDLLFKYSVTNEGESLYKNIILFVGSTIENQRSYAQPLNLIKESMGKGDILIIGHRLDTDSSKIKLNFSRNNGNGKHSDLAQRKMVLDLLNIEDDFYDVERKFSPEYNARVIHIILNTDIQIKFETKSFKKIVSLSNKDKILIWRHMHHKYPDVIEILNKVGFNVVHASTSIDHEQIFVISQVKQALN